MNRVQRKEDGYWYLGDDYLAGDDIYKSEAMMSSDREYALALELLERSMAFRELAGYLDV